MHSFSADSQGRIFKDKVFSIRWVFRAELDGRFAAVGYAELGIGFTLQFEPINCVIFRVKSNQVV